MSRFWLTITLCIVLTIASGLLLSLVISSAPIVGISAGVIGYGATRVIGYGATRVIGYHLFIRRDQNESR